jgi:hypothetical protein
LSRRLSNFPENAPLDSRKRDWSQGTLLTSLRIWSKALLDSRSAPVSILPSEYRAKNLLPNRSILIIAIVSAAALGGGVLTYAIGIPGSPCSGTAGTTRDFTIIADSNGFNDSLAHYQQGQSWPAIQWPVIGVSRCDMVVIKIVNTDTQTHGFAVSYYANKGTEVQGQQSLTIQFLASKTGQFRIYCIVLCTAHTFMLYGTLNVS